MTTTSNGPSRRTLVKGAAWSVPVVAVGAAAPAMAASPDPGLNGWVLISRESPRRGNCRVRYDGYRNGDATYDGVRLGLWVWDASSAQITSPPTLILHLPYQVNWSFDTGNSGWSLPSYLGVSGGFHRYQSLYSGGYTDNPNGPGGLPEVVLTGRPHFVGDTGWSSCPSDRRQRITRRVGINGEIIEFTREVAFPTGAWLEESPEQLESGVETTDIDASPEQIEYGVS